MAAVSTVGKNVRQWSYHCSKATSSVSVSSSEPCMMHHQAHAHSSVDSDGLQRRQTTPLLPAHSHAHRLVVVLALGIVTENGVHERERLELGGGLGRRVLIRVLQAAEGNRRLNAWR